MSVITETDEQINTVKDDVRNAKNRLSKIIADEFMGWDDYNSEYQTKLAKAFLALVEVEALL